MKYFLYILPFFSFIFSYLFLNEYLYRSRKIQCINIVGKTINDILPWIKENGACLLIDDCIYDNSRKNGTILKQYPSPETIISYQAPIHCIVTKKVDKNILFIENLIGKFFYEIESILKKNNILYNKIYIESFYPKNTIYSCGWSKNKKELTIYISTGLNKRYCICNLKNINCKDLKNYYHEINFKCHNNNLQCFENGLLINNFLPNNGKIINAYASIYLEHE